MFENDGCTLFPEGTWATCCDIHDQAFAVGTEFHEFISANWQLYTCMSQHNPIMALLALIGVMTLGATFFFLGRKRRPTR
jgi:LPXTG-motif cell wall-anchored protein